MTDQVRQSETWAARFAAMSQEDRVMTIVEDGSTLDALIAEAEREAEAQANWQPTHGFLVGMRRALLALVQDHDSTGTVRRLYQSGFSDDHEAAKIIQLAQEEIADD